MHTLIRTSQGSGGAEGEGEGEPVIVKLPVLPPIKTGWGR